MPSRQPHWPRTCEPSLASFAGELARRAWTTWWSADSRSRRPPRHAALALAGLLDAEPMPATPGDTIAAPYTRDELHLDRIGTLLAHPEEHFRDVYGWGTADFDALGLFTPLAAGAGRDQHRALGPAHPARGAAHCSRPTSWGSRSTSRSARRG